MNPLKIFKKNKKKETPKRPLSEKKDLEEPERKISKNEMEECECFPIRLPVQLNKLTSKNIK